MAGDASNAGGNVYVKSKVRQSTDRLALLLEHGSEFSSVQGSVLPDCDIIVAAQ